MATSKTRKPATKTAKSPAKKSAGAPAFGSPEWQKRYGRGKKSGGKAKAKK